MPVVDAYRDVGLSYDERARGQFLLRWRQNEAGPNGTIERKQRTLMTFSVDERRRMEDEIGRALRTVGFWRRPTTLEAPAMPLAIDLERAARDWVFWKVGVKGVSANTRANLARAMKRFFTELRVVLGAGAEDPIPPSTLTAHHVQLVTGRWRDRYGEGTVYQTIAAVVDMWEWVADDPARYPDVPAPPYNRDRVMPTNARYEAPEVYPTWAEADACVRRIRLTFPRHMAIIMRYTGLRIEQVSMIHREDIDTEGCSLVVRKGKSRREQALMRRVPVSPHLLADLGGWLAGHSAGPLFPDATAIDGQGLPVPIRSYRNQTRYVTEAWEAATAADEARREVWSPPNRLKNSPDHAFRRALQGALMEGGIGDAVLDHLVGHAPRSTRGKSYVKPPASIVRQAVATIPPIDWSNVVHLSGRDRRSA